MGRTGKMWGHQQLGLEPDVFTSAKALGGGVPIGAMMCKEKCNVFNPGDHASTYGGNPLACAAGVAVTSTIDSDKLVENAHARGIQFRGEVNEMIKEFPNIIKEVRGWGLINGVELVNTGPDGLNAAKVTAKLMTMGVLVVPAGTHVVRFVPPLIISESDIKEVVVQLRKALVELSAGQSN